MNCLIVDDEAPAVFLMEDNIKRTPFLQLVGSCNNAYRAMERIQEEKIDLVFLDIEMPGLNGTELIKTMAHQMPMVIFVTAYKKYALEGYELNVVDYLLKPVAYERFLKSVNKALEYFQNKNQKTNPSEIDYFFVNADYSHIKLHFVDVLFIEAMKDYIKIFTTEKEEPVISRLSLKSVVERLPADTFLRVQKSFIVNLNKITSIKRNRIFIGKHYIPFSDAVKDELFQLIDPHKWIKE